MSDHPNPVNQILLTVSGEIDPCIKERIIRGECPQADYIAMAQGFPADLMDYRVAREVGGHIGRLFEKIGGPNLMLAWACFCRRRYYRALFTDGEQVGIPLAFLLKFFAPRGRPRHFMIAHRLSVKKKMVFFDWFGVRTQIDIFFVYSTWQQAFIRTRWKLPANRVIYTPFMVDSSFFNPGNVPEHSSIKELTNKDVSIISAVGLEHRDYPTLIQAIHDLPVQVVMAAASPWSKQKNTSEGIPLPKNVLVRRFTQYELRDLYAASQFIVMPLFPVDFQAGVTAILEAMAMGKAVICTRTPGQTDAIVDGETGRYVEPGDANSLRAAIEWFLNNPEDVEQMGQNARRRVVQDMSLDRYVHRLGMYVKEGL